MNLYIANTKSDQDNTFWIPPLLLNDKPMHLYLACNQWDTLQVVMCEDIPADVLKYTKDKCKEIQVVDDGCGITKHKVDILCELYPEKAGTIRKNFMLGRNVYDLLKN